MHWNMGQLGRWDCESSIGACVFVGTGCAFIVGGLVFDVVGFSEGDLVVVSISLIYLHKIFINSTAINTMQIIAIISYSNTYNNTLMS